MANLGNLIVRGVTRILGDAYANKFIGNLQGNADTATSAIKASTADSATSAASANKASIATAVQDYGTSDYREIKIGYNGIGLSSSTITHAVGFTDNGTKIKDISKDEFRNWLATASGTWNISITGNATTATDADLLDGVHYQNILERQGSGHSESKTATGWFRIAETLTNDAGGITFLLAIQRNYSYANNESYLFSISIAYYGGISITQLSGYANNRLITKIRVDWSPSQIAYIDLYINASYTNNNYYWYTVGCAKSYTAWTANPTLVGHAYEFTTVQGCKSDRGFTGDIVGNASSATKWAVPRTITLTGSVTGSVSIDGSGNVSLATTTNHTHNYAGSSSAGGSANSALALLYTNNFNTNYGDCAVFQQGYNISDFPHNGWFNSIKMLHNNSHGYFTEIATSFTGEDGMWRRALQGGSQAGWYKMLDSGNYNSYALPLSGGTLTGSVTMRGMDTDLVRDIVYDGTSGWARDLIALQVDGVRKFSVGAYGDYTAGASSNGIYYGYIGCNPYDGLNLRISETSLSWGGNPILHSGNFNSYAPTLTGTGATGTWGINISGTANSASYASVLLSIRKPTTDTVKYDKPFSYFVGQPAIGTAEGNAYAGSSSNYNLLSFPPEGTTHNSEYANVMTLRLSWDKTKYWHDIFASPNLQFLWHRYVNNGTAYDWCRIVDETTSRTWGINISGNAATASTIVVGQGAADVYRSVYFADNSSINSVVVDSKLKYNPSSGDLKVNKINSGTPITDLTIGSQSVAYATSAGSATDADAVNGISLTWSGNIASSQWIATWESGTSIRAMSAYNTFISMCSYLDEGSSDVTDGTMFITSYATDNGFDDPNGRNKPYKRKASFLWNYINNKCSSIYATQSWVNSNYYTCSESDSRYIQSETDPVWTAAKGNYYTKTECNNRYIQSETDPVWTAAKGNYYTKTECNDKFQPKGTYLTEQSLQGYATQEWVRGEEYLYRSGGTMDARAEIGITTKLFIGNSTSPDTCYTKFNCILHGGGNESNPNWVIHDNGYAEFKSSVSANAFYASSDIRLKNILDDINIDFDKLKLIPKKYYTWKGSDILQLGTIAQDIQKIYPEVVSKNENGYLSVDYSKLSIIALAAIDKLNERIKELECQIKL